MNMRSLSLNSAIPVSEKRSSIVIPFVLGMSINIISIFIGNPYIISLIGLVVACFATVAWANKPIPWLVLVSVLTANPANLSTSIALNILFAYIFLVLNMHYLHRLPHWLILVNIISLISVLGSFFNWSAGISPGNIFTQCGAITNYLLGPFFFIPIIFARIKEKFEPEQMLKVLVFALIIPTLILLFMARTLGQPMLDSNAVLYGYEVNVSVYQLGNLDFQLTRTQSGIVLASLICASFAVIISKVARWLRFTSAVCIAVAGFLMLVTGSVGSSLAALCGITSILLIGKRHFPVRRIALITFIAAGLIFFTWTLLPQGIHKYASSRYEERFTGGGRVDISDRVILWQKSLKYLAENPLGIGWELYIEPIGTYPHNDYLSYAIAFGFMCGFLYLFVPAKLLLSLVVFKPVSYEPAQIAVVLAGIGVSTVFLVNSFTDHLTANRWYYNIVWSVIWYSYFASKSTTVKDSAARNFQGHVE